MRVEVPLLLLTWLMAQVVATEEVVELADRLAEFDVVALGTITDTDILDAKLPDGRDGYVPVGQLSVEEVMHSTGSPPSSPLKKPSTAHAAEPSAPGTSRTSPACPATHG